MSLQAYLDGKRGYGSAVITVDLTAPLVTISAPANGATVFVDNPILAFTADEGYIDVLLDGSPLIISSGENLPPLAEGSHTVRVEATDTAGNTGSAATVFTVDSDRPPLADAGPDQLVEPKSLVTLDGSASHDSDGVIVSYAWAQIAGGTVTIENQDEINAEFTAPVPFVFTEITLTFRLTVTDDAGQESMDDVNIIVVKTDMDDDDDTDGKDLAEIAGHPMTTHQLEAVAVHFGVLED